ncbi:hypothetical protein, partial [Pseudomonas chlororaphis]|uniref:hypothetical protein n=1 Tax=Pseudomonas chlororaphis TaxID=587753 RepID=UPI001B31D49D|nr:hypothetical protein [Pseudomonas chlororaphis]
LTEPIGCNCLTISGGRLRSTLAEGKGIFTISLAGLDLEAIGARLGCALALGLALLAAVAFFTGLVLSATCLFPGGDLLAASLHRAVTGKGVRKVYPSV